jgi:hypothetical protein
MQRTGTTSVGRFLKDAGLRVAGWPADERNQWTNAWYAGDFESIFGSDEFQACNGFEDSPWWMPGFYKVLYHRFPGAKFVLFTRDPDAWFASMVSHSGGVAIGDNRVHSRIYRRELEFHALLAAGRIDDIDYDPERVDRMMDLDSMGEHYKAIYRLHNLEVAEFFQARAPESLHCGMLEDPNKWQKLASFLGVEIAPGYRVHANASSRNRPSGATSRGAPRR